VPDPGRRVLDGSDQFYPEEHPIGKVCVESFWIDVHPVTVGEFCRFVEDTGYVTLAERRSGRAIVRPRPRARS